MLEVVGRVSCLLKLEGDIAIHAHPTHRLVVMLTNLRLLLDLSKGYVCHEVTRLVMRRAHCTCVRVGVEEL